jgi:Fe-S-cluster containining protein
MKIIGIANPNMNVPAIAQKTFVELKNRVEALELVQFVLKKLQKNHDPIKRARYIHRLVDEVNEYINNDPKIRVLSPCTTGCAACCHTQVSVTQDEAELLASHIREGKTLNMDRLAVQMAAKNSAAAWYALSHEERKCVFLNDQNMCSAYEDRPSVCRTNAVIGDASQCDTTNGVGPTRLVKTPEADLVIYASYFYSSEGGTLPYMLAKALKLTDS